MEGIQSRRTYDRARFAGLGIEAVELFGYQKYLGAQRRLPDHTHPGCVELCFLSRGRQCFRVEGRNFWMSGGQVFITFPGERHSTGDHPMEKSELYWLILEIERGNGLLGLSAPVAERLRQDLLALRDRRLFEVEPGTEQVLADLERELRRDEAQPLLCHALLCRFLHATVKGARQRRKGATSRFDAVLAYIASHLDAPLPVAELARVAELSESRFKATFKQAHGMSPAEYVARARVDRARERLLDSGDTVTRIAGDLGFSTPQYFASVFRRFTGCTPGEFRRRGIANGPDSSGQSP
jgi:AraC-like DNA-binding protein/quercetin dioxygenase-like cupin family protein